MAILNELEWFDHYFYNTKNLCNAYLFNSTDSDYFEIAPFSGNFKMIVAAESEDGINPAIVSGRVGSFVATTDYQDPKWVEYNVDVTSLTSVAGATFNGVVAKYAKDDVWYYINMGEPETLYRYAPRFDGAATYMRLVVPYQNYVGYKSSVKFRNYIPTDSEQYGRFMATADFTCSLDVGVSKTKFRLTGCTATLDGVPIVSGSTLIPTDSDEHIVEMTSTVSTGLWVAVGAYSNVGTEVNKIIKAILYDLHMADDFFPLDGPFSEYPLFTGVNGKELRAYNFTASDIMEISV